MPTIRVNVNEDGSKTKISVEGVQGESCMSLTESLENAIFGAGGAQVTRTEEFYMEPEQGVDSLV